MIFWLAFFLALCFGVAVVIGAPYLPVFSADARRLLDSLGCGDGKKFVDLGCGDGRVLVLAARRGYRVVGYEINPLLWLVAWLRSLPYKKNIKVQLVSYWSADLSSYDVVYVFLIGRLMLKLENKLNRELKKGAILISYVFKLPHKKPYKTTKNASLYRF